MTALSIATLGTRASAARAASYFSARAPRRAFLNHQFRKDSSVASITALRQSTCAVPELEQSLEVTHPAYDVIQKDVVPEYGAYCTLYRHKKSGAELLSVAVDDDNKVCTNKGRIESVMNQA